MDCFRVSTRVSEVRALPEKECELLDIIAFIEAFIVTYHLGKISLTEESVWKRRQIGNLRRSIRDAKRTKIRPRSISWLPVAKRLDMQTKCYRNTNVRLCYRLDNTFVVKYMFTFGQRTVRPGTYHIIQTTAVPLLYYQLDPERGRLATRVDGSLIAGEQALYTLYMLHPHTIFSIPSGSVYVLMAVQKTIFAFDVISCSPPDNAKSPTEHVDWTGSISRDGNETEEEEDVVLKPSFPSDSGFREILVSPPQLECVSQQPTSLEIVPQKQASVTNSATNQSRGIQQFDDPRNVVDETRENATHDTPPLDLRVGERKCDSTDASREECEANENWENFLNSFDI